MEGGLDTSVFPYAHVSKCSIQGMRLRSRPTDQRFWIAPILAIRLLLQGANFTRPGNEKRSLLQHIPERVQHVLPQHSALWALHNAFDNGKLPLLGDLCKTETVFHAGMGGRGLQSHTAPKNDTTLSLNQSGSQRLTKRWQSR